MGQSKFFHDGYHSKSKFDMDFYPRLPYGSYKKLYGQFYNPPYHTYPCSQGVRGYEKPPVPLYPVTPIYPMKEKRLVIKEAKKIYHFTTGDVDAVLYGYLRDESNVIPQLHSLSGVRFENHNPSDTLQPITKGKLCTTRIPHPELPASLTIKEITLDCISHIGVFTNEVISKGTRFGPYAGSIVNPHDIENAKMGHPQSWEVFNGGKLSHFINGSSNPHNWMKLVNNARYSSEQNLALVQNRLDLYYEVIEDIKPGQELLVWYGDEYVKYMELPMSLNERGTAPLTPSPPTQPAAVGSFPCKRCGKIFSYEYYREKHLKYTRCVDMGDRKYPCHLCQRSFEKKDRLRIHILHVHQKYRPHVCKICGKRFSQSSSLNKHSRVHTGERPYSCPHCPKSFTASSILRTHLRQHNGERPFKCKFCGKAFASHAAHDSHVRRTHDKLKICSCRICGKTFSMEFELKFHLSTHTTAEIANLEDDSNNNTPYLDGNNKKRTLSEKSDSSLIIDV